MAESVLAPLRLLNRRRPLAPIYAAAAMMVSVEIVGIVWLLAHFDAATYQLVTPLVATVAATAATIGWAAAGWVAHRTARVQLTINLIATRFSQPLFHEQITRFNRHFGDENAAKVDTAMMAALDASRDPTDQKIVQSVRYILNYFEFLASGVLAGELDLDIVRNNLRANTLYYYDKCLPYITDLRRGDARLLENLTALQAHLRDYRPS